MHSPDPIPCEIALAIMVILAPLLLTILLALAILLADGRA